MFDYVALGHVHRYQRIESAPTYAYYTGTPYQLDFSEAGDRKFFNFIVFEENMPRIEAVEFDLKNPLNVFEVNQEDVYNHLPELKRITGYIKIFLKVEDRTNVHHIIDRLREELGEKLIKIEQVSDSSRSERKWSESAKLNPIELYREYYQIAYNKELPQEIERTFVELLRRAEEKV